jgi:large subunit ribosomal protein L4
LIGRADVVGGCQRGGGHKRLYGRKEMAVNVVARKPVKHGLALNRKERKAALRSVLSAHADEGTLGVLADDAFDAPSTKTAAELVEAWGKEPPLVVVVSEDQDAVAKSFRNLERAVVVTPAEVEVGSLVWARSLLVTQAALEQVQGRAS